MAAEKKRLSMSKSTNKFEEPNGVVGLGIVAAMHEEGPQDPILRKNKAAIFAVSPRSSNPISIFSQKNGFGYGNVKKRPSLEELAMSEDYTCVISHVENEKREYFDGDLLSVTDGSGQKFVFNTAVTSDGGAGNGYWVSSVGFGASSMANHGGGGDAAECLTADFLNSCFLCKKKLYGLDIFMYRGEKAFCSAECRDKHISVDEHKEKRVSGMKKPSEYSVSPCSGPMKFSAGVVAS